MKLFLFTELLKFFPILLSIKLALFTFELLLLRLAEVGVKLFLSEILVFSVFRSRHKLIFSNSTLLGKARCLGRFEIYLVTKSSVNFCCESLLLSSNRLFFIVKIFLILIFPEIEIESIVLKLYEYLIKSAAKLTTSIEKLSHLFKGISCKGNFEW